MNIWNKIESNKVRAKFWCEDCKCEVFVPVLDLQTIGDPICEDCDMELVFDGLEAQT